MTSQKLDKCQQEAEEVKILMKENVNKVFDRGVKLEELDVRANELKDMAMDFKKTAQTVERKTRWEKWRWYIISGVIVALLVIIIIAIIISQLSGGGEPPTVANEGN